MVTETLPGTSPLTTGKMMSLMGAVTALFSVVMALLVLFVIPGACSFLGGLELLLLTGLFLAGVAAFFVGKLLSRR